MYMYMYIAIERTGVSVAVRGFGTLTYTYTCAYKRELFGGIVDSLEEIRLETLITLTASA